MPHIGSCFAWTETPSSWRRNLYYKIFKGVSLKVPANYGAAP